MTVGLLGYHPWGDKKIGIGVSRIWIEPNPVYLTRGFWLERMDGTKTDFSYYQCVQPASMLRDFKSACRVAIAPTVIEFRKEFFRQKSQNGKVPCPISGKAISIRESHVDHCPPNTFESIVGEFIAQNKVDVSLSPISDHSDGNVGNFFTDKAFEREWVVFHNKRATLRILSAEANLGLKGG